ncbi:MAG: PAS domain-containing sensor histidine kinase [Candidatus Pacebacteria bacterium]|nr:PAS domain-containing sensor histidine kinase [Candidatus Paceibacterota bacterium]
MSNSKGKKKQETISARNRNHASYHEHTTKTVEANEKLYRYLVQLSPNPLFIHSEGKFKFLNEAAVAFFGAKKAEDIMGKLVIDFVHPDYHKQLLRRMKATFEEKRTLPLVEYKMLTLDGKEKTVEIASNPFTYQGKPAAQGTIIDVTKHKKKEEFLRIQRETLAIKIKLEEEKLRTEFIADAMHEIRTPLAIIRGNVDLALGFGKNRKLKSPKIALRAISYEVEHLSRLLRDLTMLTSRGGEFEWENLTDTVDLSKLLEEGVKRTQVLARKMNISVRIPKKIPSLSIKGDKAYMEKLILNLIKNAITYNKKDGWVKVGGSKIGDKAVLTMEDNGIGISEYDLPHIFERFYRAEKMRDPEGKRTGLGLAISKWITEIHGGTIHVISTLGKGSTFTVFLPLLK